MTNSRPRRRAVMVSAAAIVLAVAAYAVSVRLGSTEQSSLPLAAKELLESSQGTENGGAGGESAEALTAARQWQEARTAPGIVAPGAYSSAFAELTGLSVVGGSWDNVTRVKYDADDVEFRDYYSNSSGGAGKYVTGRVTGLAADDQGYVYAAGAAGGVWRSSTGGGNWTPIADAIPSLSSGALELDQDGALWYATGEANTGGTSYVGNGVYKLANPRSGSFSIANRVGGTELESTTINAIRFAGDKVWVATLRGVWSHSRTSTSGPWTLSLVPNPAFLPKSMETYLQDSSIKLGGQDTTANAPYKNIVNDIAIDPKNPNHLIAAVGWRSGDTYNGFYETTNGGAKWVKINPTGAINPKEIGNVSFAYAADGKQLYAMNQSPTLLNKLTGTVNSYLDGIYVSNSGKIEGPWSKIADSHKLANSGSALKQSVSGKGYGPGIQSWYNQLLLVDPTNSNHVIAGLEEVYETLDGGANWRTIGPYWNFYFPCWWYDATYSADGTGNRCPLTTHPDQHSVAVGKSAGGALQLYIGNDGGVYRRPLNGGSVNDNGNATDWKSLNDGTMDALQYYAVDVGLADPTNDHTPPGTDSVIISGGLQDNGGSILRVGAPDGEMNSNFGGDGGDVLVDPNDGCNIVQEYVVLSMRVTNKCARIVPALGDDPAAFIDLSKANTRNIAPPDINARFIAPFVASTTNIDHWLAGGNTVWWQDKGFDITGPGDWKPVKTWASAARVTTALAMSGNVAVAAWCGPCNNAGFARGLATGVYNPATKAWTWTDRALSGVPNRYISGAAVDGGTMYIVLNGFSRRFTEGPGADVGHVFKSTDGGATWTSIDGAGASAFPDVPANSIVVSGGRIIVGTDLGVVTSSNGGASWQRLGGNFPATVAIDVELGPDGKVYAATHARGIWRIDLP